MACRLPRELNVRIRAMEDIELRNGLSAISYMYMVAACPDTNGNVLLLQT